MDGRELSRRELLRRGALAGGVLLGGSVLASCGGDGESADTVQTTATTATTAGTTAAAEPNQGGTLRVGIGGGGAEGSVDAHVSTGNADIARRNSLYDGLLVWTPEYEITPALAAEFEPNATADEWTIRLRDDVEFHNGKTLTADDLIFTLERILDPDTAAIGATLLVNLDPNGITKLDDLTVRLKLKQPDVIFDQGFAGGTNLIVPVDYDPQDPVGSGPFRLKSFAPGQETVLERFENYWGEGPFVDELVLVEISEDTARVNALLAGQVEAIDSVPFAQIPVVEGNSDLALLVSETGGWRPLTMQIDTPPFDDVRVRQAFRLLVDRPQMVEQALAGQGRVGNDIYGLLDSCYPSDFPQREQDVEQARSLLKAAGKENLSVELVTAPLQAGLLESSQIFAEQAKAAGVTVNVRKLDPSTYYNGYLEYPFSVSWWATPTYLYVVSLTAVPGAPWNETHQAWPEFTDLYTQALAEVDEAKRCDIIHEMQRMQYEEGGYIIWGFTNQIDGYSNRVTGFVPASSGFPLTQFEFNRVSFV